MKEKELRLALVFYGGVSLAIYQHGVNVEILNLIRASKAYHKARSSTAGPVDANAEVHPAKGSRTTSTEAIYVDLLKLIGRSLDLRIIIDVITGSSAGGINGIALARAIAHDLSLSPLTELWFAKADLKQLIAPDARAGPWSKWYFWPFMRPLMTHLSHEGMLPRNPDAEIRERISTFLRSRWFKPPFDGPYFSNLLLDGLAAMESVGSADATLLPPEVRLDLLIAVTDYYGSQQTVFLHDPGEIYEREHRQFLRFCAERSATGRYKSDFESANIPSLAFAGRASASYPGAFPPAQIKEMDGIIASRSMDWPERENFLNSNFAYYQDIGMQRDATTLLDGSILNNKPILAAIEAIRTHSAYREVDRRLVYIDPRPDRPNIPSITKVPGFFTTLRRALSDLPRHSPIYEELEETSRFNDQVSRLKAIMQISRPQVEALIEETTSGELTGRITIEQLRHWRLTSNTLLSQTAIVYNAWMRALVLESADVLSEIIMRKCGYRHRSRHAHWIHKVIEAWCGTQGMFPENYKIPVSVAKDAELPAFGRFIVDFGAKYKRRRITFILQDINRLYEDKEILYGCGTSPEQLDNLKREISHCLKSISGYDDIEISHAGFADLIDVLFKGVPSDAMPSPQIFVAQNQAALSELVLAVGKECGLVGANEELDAILASPLVSEMGPNCRRVVLTGYLGFPYWDVILLPAMSALGLETSAFEEVLVDRISPNDAKTICPDTEASRLRGASMIGFGGFLSRSARENDYLWGRIHAIDRLFDIVTSTAASELADVHPDLRALKKRAFQAMLHQESGRLTHIPDILAAVDAIVEGL
ncbi:patatin-like protein [Sphingobium aquiterrae]|uniref:patatin-like protein n=1 Tax=Sphingobium aquiterrae TaxID=2038656 RepID=UPI00301AFC55